MNFLFLTNKPPFPLVDGGCIATFNMVQSLVDLGHTATVLSFSTAKHPGNLDAIPDEIKSKIDFHFVPVNTDLSASSALRNLLFSKLPYNAERFINHSYEHALISLLKRNSFDIVQLEGLYLCPYIDTVRKFSDAKLSFRSHNIEAEIWERTAMNESALAKRGYMKLLSKRIARFERSFVNKYDFLVPITDRDASVFKTAGNVKPCHVSPAGYNVEKWKPYHGGNGYPHLFHLGALDWIPNQEGLLWFCKTVWPDVHEKFPDLRFYVAGRNAPDKFRQTVSSFSGIDFVGEVPDAADFMCKQGIMVVPLLSGSGMRIKIVEGMALGKTIITTTIGTEGIGSEHQENIVIADNKKEFFTELCTLVEDEHYCKGIGLNARKFIESNFDNRAIAGKLVQFFEMNF